MIVPERVKERWVVPPSLEERFSNHTHPELKSIQADLQSALLETGSKTNETIETIKTQLEVEKIKNSELQKKLELLEMSQMALVSRLEAIENM